MNKGLGTLVLGVVALAGCKPEASHSSDGDVLAAAGMPGAVAATALSEQDSTPMVVRRVWGGPLWVAWSVVSPDGRYLAFVDQESGNLAVREISTGDVRYLTHDASQDQYAEGAAISPDGQQIAYVWCPEATEPPFELRTIDREGGQPRVLFNGESFGRYSTVAWSPGGQQILIFGMDKEGAFQLALVRVADGSVRTLKEIGSFWRWPRGVSFSPDGRYLVYDLPEERNSDERDIFVLTVDSGEEVPLIQHAANDFVLGWAPDGEHILFASDRTGTLGAWLLPVTDGKATGTPRLVKPDLWRATPSGFTRDGSFYYGVPMSTQAIYVASLDPATGAVLAAPTPASPDYLGNHFSPDWSPDGRYLGYASRGGQSSSSGLGEPMISIRSVETGQTRQLRVPNLKLFGGFRWFADGHHLLVPGVDRNDQVGVFKVDVQTGNAEPLPALTGVRVPSLIDWSADGKSVFYLLWQSGETRIAVTDLESGEQKLLYDKQPSSAVALSPDGRQLAFTVGDGGERSLMLMPATGGAPSELLRFQVGNDQNVSDIAWSSDGRYVLYVRPWEDKSELWRVPVAGGPPEELDLSVEGLEKIRFHPDGRRIAIEAFRSGGEVWVMEDFLPATAGTSDEK
jgi:Tol biopolymer transport system component